MSISWEAAPDSRVLDPVPGAKVGQYRDRTLVVTVYLHKRTCLEVDYILDPCSLRLMSNLRKVVFEYV